MAVGSAVELAESSGGTRPQAQLVSEKGDGGLMTTRLLAILMVSAVVLVGCGGEDRGNDNAAVKGTAVEDAYKQMRKTRGELGSVAEKLAVTKKFLEEFPESDRTAGEIYAGFYYQGNELGDTSGAVTYAESIRAGLSDPEIAREVDKSLIQIYSESRMTAKMVTLADRLAAAGALDFDDQWNVIVGAVATSEWKLARDYCAKARGMVSAAAIRADNPDEEYSEEEVVEAVNHRVGMILVKDGWARANLGQTAEALTDFAKADKLIPRYYFDVPEYDLNVYWGNTLLMMGDFEAAVDRFATDGLIMRNEESLAGLKKAYAGIHGSEAGYEAYATELHRSIARPVDDFEMADYAGDRHRFFDLRGEVTLLTLWFPT
jgi:tetratricopeptide (TPR) repeat protein